MESLTKQQMVLLTLLVSVITSITTSIVIISLENQSPSGVTNTIERVIDESVAATVPGNSTAAADTAASSDSSGGLAPAVATMKRSIAFIHDYDIPGAVSGLGVVVNVQGDVMTDKAVLGDISDYAVTYPDGSEYRAAVVESQADGDIVFLEPIGAPRAASSTPFAPARIDASPAIGEIAASLGGTDAGTLRLGVISQLSASSTVSTTLDGDTLLLGSPLFDSSGDLLGLRTSSLATASSTEFYAVSAIVGAIPQ